MNNLGKIQFGYILSPTHWNLGYATEVCRKMMTLLKTERGIYRIGTFVDAENEASIRVLEKSGLKEEAAGEEVSFCQSGQRASGLYSV